MKERKKKKFRLDTLKKSSSSLILIVLLSQIYLQFNKKWLVNIKLKDQGQKMP